jgi:hypothetical protein
MWKTGATGRGVTVEAWNAALQTTGPGRPSLRSPLPNLVGGAAKDSM